jgi:hypothetical protein
MGKTNKGTLPMSRALLTLCLLAGLSGLAQAANVVHAPGPNSGRLRRTAEHIFQLADRDKNGALDLAEQAEGDQRAERALRQLVHDNVIGGPIALPGVVEPQLADPSAMTGPEFTQHFQALAAARDAAVRASRVGGYQSPVLQAATGPTPIFVAGGGGGRERDKYDDDRLRDERIARDRRYRQDDRYYTPQQNYFQPNSFQPAPAPVFSAPVHPGMADRGPHSGSERGSESRREPKANEPVTKHEPRSHEPPPRRELQHNTGHHGK